MYRRKGRGQRAEGLLRECLKRCSVLCPLKKMAAGCSILLVALFSLLSKAFHVSAVCLADCSGNSICEDIQQKGGKGSESNFHDKSAKEL